MFIDMHTHFLPGIDDGSKDLTMTKNMLYQAKEEGITEIIATPHYIPGFNEYNKDKLFEVYKQVNNFIIDSKLAIKIHLGNELFFDNEALTSLKTGDCLTLAGSKYVLIEFSSRLNKNVIDNILYQIQLEGYKLIFAHVERYDIFDDVEMLEYYIEKGCLLQVNSNTILNGSKSRKRYLRDLLINNYIHFISSDCHGDKIRTPKMKDAYEQVCQISSEKANDLFYNNAKRIIEGKNIRIEKPRKFSQNGWWGGLTNWINRK